MSTYYYLACDKCKQYADFYTWQMGGYGNAAPIESFKFACAHTTDCGHSNLKVYSEHDLPDEYENVVCDADAFIERTRDMFPHSSDWDLPDTISEAQEQWAERFRRRGRF